MIVRVKRITYDEFNDLVKDKGSRAMYFDVPSTIDGVKFRGVYTGTGYDEIAVAWPIDRPEEDQHAFSKKAMCGQPVEEFEIRDTLN